MSYESRRLALRAALECNVRPGELLGFAETINRWLSLDDAPCAAPSADVGQQDGAKDEIMQSLRNVLAHVGELFQLNASNETLSQSELNQRIASCQSAIDAIPGEMSDLVAKAVADYMEAHPVVGASTTDLAALTDRVDALDGGSEDFTGATDPAPASLPPEGLIPSTGSGDLPPTTPNDPAPLVSPPEPVTSDGVGLPTDAGSAGATDAPPLDAA